jgi:putative ABC transport system substrate-binding protein
LDWTVVTNVKIDYRWGAGNADYIRKFAAELVALAPDVILSAGSPSVAVTGGDRLRRVARPASPSGAT